ncbi:MAG: hypothetical protein AAGN66_00225 [Acidobacteriota bacterium]
MKPIFGALCASLGILLLSASLATPASANSFAVLADLAVRSATSYEAPARPAIIAPARRWIGPDGEPLPFRTDAQVLEFLRTADVVRTKVLTSGSTKPLKLYLEKDGVRADAIFRTVAASKHRTGGHLNRKQFRDHYAFEIAAYEVSRLVGLDHVPPATLRRIDGREGSVQLWVENATSETDRIERGDKPARPAHINFQKHMMRVFDHLIYNFDRNTGNILVDADHKVWLVDHTRSFKSSPEFPEGPPVVVCERSMWKHLRGIEETELRDRLRPYLESLELEATVERHRALVNHLEHLIDERGESAVLFDLNA